MKRTIRNAVFETNSSSSHNLIFINSPNNCKGEKIKNLKTLKYVDRSQFIHNTEYETAKHIPIETMEQRANLVYTLTQAYIREYIGEFRDKKDMYDKMMECYNKYNKNFNYKRLTDHDEKQKLASMFFGTILGNPPWNENCYNILTLDESGELMEVGYGEFSFDSNDSKRVHRYIYSFLDAIFTTEDIFIKFIENGLSFTTIDW